VIRFIFTIITPKFIRYFACILAFSLFVLALLRVYSLSSNVFDLGIFSTNFFNVNEEWERSIFGHIQPLMHLWAVIYKIFSPIVSPFVLIGGQVLLILGSILIVWRAFGPWPGTAMLLYYPLWANALFDFHFDHLSIPILIIFFINCDQKNFKFAALTASSLVLVKEIFSLQVISCGLYFVWLAIQNRHKYHFKLLLFLSGLLFLWGSFWFYGSLYWILPYSSGVGVSEFQSEAYSWLGAGTLDKLSTVLFKPTIWLLDIINSTDKLKFLAVIFGSLAFIPFLKPSALIVALPPLLLSLLSQNESHFSYANHYTAGLIAPIIVAMRDSIPVAKKIWINTLSAIFSKSKLSFGQLFGLFFGFWILFSHWALAPSPISRLFWSDKVWSYSWQAYIPSKRDNIIKEAILKHIPSDPEVSVSTQNSLNYGHLSSRKLYLPFPQGVVYPHPVPSWGKEGKSYLFDLIPNNGKASTKYDEKLVDYVVLDSKRPWFVIDQGCDWLYGRCMNDKVANEYLGWVEKAKSIMQVVFERDGFIILKRNKNSE
jgi:uncharacterized membrane protein